MLISRLQDPAAAIALVSARPSQDHTLNAKQLDDEERDADLKRAKDLVKLHYEVKEVHKRGQLSKGLEDARSAVARAVDGV